MTGFEPYPSAQDGVPETMRSFRLLAGIAGAFSALPLLVYPLLFGDLRAEELLETGVFLLVLAIISLLPFALLIALAAKLSAVARWVSLGLLIGFEALAAYEFVRSTDGQAGLIFLFLPFYLTVLVPLVSATDILVKVVARRICR